MSIQALKNQLAELRNDLEAMRGQVEAISLRVAPLPHTLQWQRAQIRELSTTVGAGPYQLAGGAYAGGLTFAQVYGAADEAQGGIHYFVVEGNEKDWELAVGTYCPRSNTLTRDQIVDSSRGGAPINWGPGARYIGVRWPRGKWKAEDRAWGCGQIADESGGSE